MRKIFVFGNPLLKRDNLALKVAKRLNGAIKGIEFRAVQSLDEVQEKGKLFIMDVAVGVEKVQLVEGIEQLHTKQPISGHDFDLALELKLLRKVGKVGGLKIIAIPADYELQKAVREVKQILSNSFSSSPSRSGSHS